MDKSLEKIKNGYANFRKKYLNEDTKIAKLMEEEQSPETMIISCCDSRVDPSIIFACSPGELFILRNIANIVPPYEKNEGLHGTSAALEFAIKFLKVKHIILLGHTNCGGIKAAINDNFPGTDFIGPWVKIAKEALNGCNKNNSNYLEECVKKSLQKSYENCYTFPFINELIEKDELKIHKWFFDLETGTVHAYDEALKNYIDL